MEFPLTCQSCRMVNLVDLDNLEKRPVDSVNWKEGFMCECGEWNTVLVSNRVLSDAMKKLAKRKVNRDFPYYLSKVLRRVRTLREGI